jgi:hypothetical protein
MEDKNSNMMPEKAVPTIQSIESSSSGLVDLVEAQGFEKNATKRLVRKLDWHLIPFLSLIYL